MNQKQIIALVIGLTFSFTLCILVAIAIYKYNPTFVGLPSLSSDTTTHDSTIDSTSSSSDTSVSTPLFLLSRNELDSLELRLVRLTTLEAVSDTLQRQNSLLTDSLLALNAQITGMTDSLLGTSSKLETSSAEAQSYQDSVKDWKSKYDQLQAQLESNKKTIEALRKKGRTAAENEAQKQKNIAEMAAIYNNSEPAKVARVLEKLNPEDAAAVLKLIDKKKAGKIIDALNPDYSAKISNLSK